VRQSRGGQTRQPLRMPRSDRRDQFPEERYFHASTPLAAVLKIVNQIIVFNANVIIWVQRLPPLFVCFPRHLPFPRISLPYISPNCPPVASAGGRY
jgi:hypothetical protein